MLRGWMSQPSPRLRHPWPLNAERLPFFSMTTLNNCQRCRGGREGGYKYYHVTHQARTAGPPTARQQISTLTGSPIPQLVPWACPAWHPGGSGTCGRAAVAPAVSKGCEPHPPTAPREDPDPAGLNNSPAGTDQRDQWGRTIRGAGRCRKAINPQFPWKPRKARLAPSKPQGRGRSRRHC